MAKIRKPELYTNSILTPIYQNGSSFYENDVEKIEKLLGKNALIVVDSTFKII